MKKLILILAIIVPSLVNGQHLNLQDLISLYEMDFIGIKQKLGTKWDANKGEKISMFFYKNNKGKDEYDEVVSKSENANILELDYLLRFPDYYHILHSQAKKDFNYITKSADMEVYGFGNYRIGFAIKLIKNERVYLVAVSKL